MSTQASPEIPFSLSQEQQNFRLIELPPELLDLLAQPEPPTISIKSASKTTGSSLSSNAATTAHLCTADRTYALRSIGTSNSLFVVQPQSELDDQDDLPRQGVTAIGQCAITLELLPCAESAKEYLHAILPIWHKSGTAISDTRQWTRKALFDDIPLSTGEIDLTWRELCLFEDAAGLVARPAPSELLSLWRSTVAAAYVERIDLENFHVEELWTALQEEEFPRPLFNAMIMRLIKPGATLQALDLKAAIDPDTALRWIATNVLEAKPQNIDGVPISTFESEWGEFIPDKWIAFAKIEKLDDLTIRPTQGRIISKVTYEFLRKRNAGAGGSGRKWHDKFKKR